MLCSLLFVSTAAAAEPPTVFLGPLTPGETTIVVEGSIDIHGGAETGLIVEWKTADEEWSAQSGHSTFVMFIPEGTSGVTPFTAQATGLEPETPYEFRAYTFSAEYEEHLEPEAPPYPESTTLAPMPTPPVITDVHFRNVGPQGATLEAAVNPRRFAATYAFEWVLESEGWSSAKVAKSEILGPLQADNAEHQVSYQASGLMPDSVYLFRVTAENEGGVAALGEKKFTTRISPTGPLTGCPNEQFRLGFSAFLPDCRAYEQVTPIDKNGVGVEGLADWLVASSDQEAPAVGFINTAASGIPAAGEGGRQEFTPMVSSLEGSSWVTRRSFPAESAQARSAWYRGTSESLKYALVEVNGNPNGRQSPAIQSLELLDVATGVVSSVATTPTAVEKGAFFSDSVANDGSFVFFESSSPVAVGAQPGVVNLYRWDRATGATSVVGMVPTGSGEEAPSGGAFGAAYAWESGEETLGGNTSSGGASAGQYVEAIHAVSPDGGQIYFTASSPGQPAQVYVRSGLEGSAPATAMVSEPNEGVTDRYVEDEHLGEPLPAAFQEATPDGSKAFFLSSQHLTSDSSTGYFDTGTDLYRYDAAAPEGERLSDITGGLEELGFEEGAHVLGLLGASADGTVGYFVAREHIVGNAEPGPRNIYRFEEEEDRGFRLTFVAPLGNEETPYYKESSNWSSSTYPRGETPGSGSTLASKNSRVSADGEALLFMSARSITGYDNHGCGLTASPTGPCPEVFLYSNASEKVECLSCDPTGAPPLGTTALTANYLNVNILQPPEGGSPEAHVTHNLSSDGDRVFFQTPTSLLPRDENGSDCHYLKHSAVNQLTLPSCLDVYEWEAVGTPGGSCTKVEVNGGCLYLLSSGQSSEPSDFVDASPDGSNVFIAASSSLVPADTDDLYDLYDVRTGGGLAGQFSEPAAPCDGEACKNGATSANSAAGISSFVGPGNPKRTTGTCKKGFVKKHRKCVKKERAHKQKGHKRPSSKKKAKAAEKERRAGSSEGGKK